MEDDSNDGYYNSISIVIVTASSLSALGTCLVIITFIMLKSTRNFASKTIIYLCLSDFLTSLSTYVALPF